MNFTSFVSQCFLCVIFWQLGTKHALQETDNPFRSSVLQEILLTRSDDDEEFQMQAQTWLLFMRDRHGLKLVQAEEHDVVPLAWDALDYQQSILPIASVLSFDAAIRNNNTVQVPALPITSKSQQIASKTNLLTTNDESASNDARTYS